MAHGGILFFDELPHFPKNILEAMREPLEDRKIMISRVNSKIEYPTDIMFIGAMNPCPCGNLLHTQRECRCNELEIKRYQNRLSEPFLDRIDLAVQMQTLSPQDQPTLTSQQMHQQVFSAMNMRYSREQLRPNGKLTDQEVNHYCLFDDDLLGMLQQASEKFSLSMRSINKIKKVARTIADLDNATQITQAHLMEALSYRKR